MTIVAGTPTVASNTAGSPPEAPPQLPSTIPLPRAECGNACHMPADATALVIVAEYVTPQRVFAADVMSADANKLGHAGQDENKVKGGCR